MFTFANIAATVGTWFLKNIHIIAIVAAVGYLVWGQLVTIPNMQKDLNDAKAEATQLRTDFDTYKRNQANLNENVNAQHNVVQGQSKIKDRIREVPVQNADKPFNDPGMLDRARILRAYQETSPISKF